ncbi:SDR family oxidoreductase [Bacillus sp. SM2101]|uniref:SDR family oxidoreductase n=1 Tax=Bacillus sp. SM2101 TaxID=2805366 RepID=UPI001BDECA5E|nr:SDR family oxidoreductase [Bacillus sp. SM2101]
MKVLVVGANGGTGRIILQLLGQSGEHDAVAMIRDDSQREDLISLGASSTVLADLEKEMSHAIEGCDAIIFAAGSGSKTGADKTKLVDEQGAINLIKTAERRGVNRFIMLSSVGADLPDLGPTDSMKGYLKSKGIADEYLSNSSLVYTIVRPGRLSYDEGTGHISISKKLADYSGDISREDVAKVLVECLNIQNTYGKTFEILSGQTDIIEALQNI